MKTLLLMRHAKSSWKDTKLEDIKRPLNKRGRKTAPRMGELLKEAELVPQTILSSTALRARQTAEAVAEKMEYIGEIIYVDDFYMAEPPAYIKRLKKLPAHFERVLVIGHNPGLEALMQTLCGQVEALPTGSIAYLSLPIKEWGEMSGEVHGELIDLWRPKELN